MSAQRMQQYHYHHHCIPSVWYTVGVQLVRLELINPFFFIVNTYCFYITLFSLKFVPRNSMTTNIKKTWREFRPEVPCPLHIGKGKVNRKSYTPGFQCWHFTPQIPKYPQKKIHHQIWALITPKAICHPIYIKCKINSQWIWKE